MEKVSYQLLEPDHVKQLGLIVLQTDVTIEDEFRYYFAEQPVSLLVNRIPFENEVNAETLKQMEFHLAQTMSTFPLDITFDSLGYACTSGAMHIGAEKISQLVSEQRQCKQLSNPLTAAIAAFDAIDARKIAYLGPYSEEVCAEMVNRFEAEGIQVVASASYHEPQDSLVGRISPKSIQRDAVNLAKQNPDIDAVFIACTNMKCANVIPEIEVQTGITALSSNQVLAWDMARNVGLPLGAEKGKLCQ